MRKKTRYIQREYSTDSKSKSDYLLIVEVVDNAPVASFTARVPVSIAYFPLLSQFKN